MSTHTPGPWEVQESRFREQGLLAVVRWEGGFPMQVASVFPAPLEAKQANARLIAAAPDLLEALERLLDSVEKEMPFVIDGEHKARAAIAKARGRP